MCPERCLAQPLIACLRNFRSSEVPRERERGAKPSTNSLCAFAKSCLSKRLPFQKAAFPKHCRLCKRLPLQGVASFLKGRLSKRMPFPKGCLPQWVPFQKLPFEKVGASPKGRRLSQRSPSQKGCHLSKRSPPFQKVSFPKGCLSEKLPLQKVAFPKGCCSPLFGVHAQVSYDCQAHST